MHNAEAIDVRRSARRQYVAGQHLKHRRLAGPVDAEQAEAFSTSDAKAESVDGNDRLTAPTTTIHPTQPVNRNGQEQINNYSCFTEWLGS